MVMQEFKINNYITLKLEEKEKTIIYVNNKPFDQCKFLLLEIPINENISMDTLDSIDEIAEKLDLEYEEEGYIYSKIPLEVEFWAHCSNLQVWAENNYDSRLIHSNLAFPLLKRLSEVGDRVAQKVFKEEIAKRFASGHHSVMEFLRNEHFLDYLTQEEQASLVEDLRSRGINPNYVEVNGILKYVSLRGLNLQNLGIKSISEIRGLESLEFLNHLILNNNQITEFNEIKNAKYLRFLHLENNSISEIKNLENLENLKTLNLKNNKITEIKGLENLKNLRVLGLSHNQISEIKGLKTLTELEYLYLDNNRISEIKGLDTLKTLRCLKLSYNNISEIKGLDTLNNLYDGLYLGSNKIPKRLLEELGGITEMGKVYSPRKFVEYCRKLKI
ncbi:hypothetical protein ES706_03475 [subsurface metagenome]